MRLDKERAMTITAAHPTAPVATARSAVLMARAQALEAEFLSQMLGHASLGQTSEAFGGGIGEEQFSSFLRDEQAAMLTKRGGIGLAEQIFKVLAERDNA
jgi:Rod binding domain-containing protein